MPVDHRPCGWPPVVRSRFHLTTRIIHSSVNPPNPDPQHPSAPTQFVTVTYFGLPAMAPGGRGSLMISPNTGIIH